LGKYVTTELKECSDYLLAALKTYRILSIRF
jgi:hypothetical protein